MDDYCAKKLEGSHIGEVGMDASEDSSWPSSALSSISQPPLIKINVYSKT